MMGWKEMLPELFSSVQDASPFLQATKYAFALLVNQLTEQRGNCASRECEIRWLFSCGPTDGTQDHFYYLKH